MSVKQVFEINDFTNVSDWERFVADLEEILAKWQLNGKDYQRSGRIIGSNEEIEGIWSERHELIRFAKTVFSFSLHKFDLNEEKKNIKEEEEEEEEEGNDNKNSEEEEYPSALLDSKDISNDWPEIRANHCLVRYFGFKTFLLLSPREQQWSEDRIKLLLSSIELSLIESKCFIPIIIEYSNQLFTGFSINHSVKTHFQTIVLKRNQKFKYLSQLLEITRKELQLERNEEPIRVSIRLTHSLNTFPDYWLINRREEEDIKWWTITETTAIQRVKSEDPLIEIQMASVWPLLSEDSVIDSENHSDLDPNSAPEWTVRCLWRDFEFPALSEELFLLENLNENFDVILDESLLSDQPMRDALSPLTHDSAHKDHKWLRDLLKDHVFIEQEEDEESCDQREEDLKFAPKGSLAQRFAVCLAKVFVRRRRLHDIRQLFRQFVRKLRDSWDSSILLANCKEAPNLNYNLFYQKLQMLNICIKEKIKSKKEEEKEEFFDAEEDIEEEEERQVEGRLYKSDLKRVSDPNQYIWIPETQEAPPLTEDMLLEQLSALEQLGEDRHLRARIQSKSLLSDMMSFKAANLNSNFEDFIKWHSPRDLNSSGELSLRFKTENNLWREMWEISKPLSAKKQKPLFDITKEGEKVLHFFDRLTFSSLSQLLLPSLRETYLSEVKNKRNRLNLPPIERPMNDNLFDWLKNEETFLLRFQSIKIKLESVVKEVETLKDNNENNEEIIKQLALDLVQKYELKVSSISILAKIIRKLFAESLINQIQETTVVGERRQSITSCLPQPVTKEFIVRVCSQKPDPHYSRSLPQRIYLLWSENETLLASALTQDLTFF